MSLAYVTPPFMKFVQGVIFFISHPFKFDQELKFCIISSIATASDRCAVKGGCSCYMSAKAHHS